MIDKKLIKKAIEAKSCLDIGLDCINCPVSRSQDWETWNCGEKGIYCRWLTNGLRPRAIRIMQEWLDSQED